MKRKIPILRKKQLGSMLDPKMLGNITQGLGNSTQAIGNVTQGAGNITQGIGNVTQGAENAVIQNSIADTKNVVNNAQNSLNNQATEKTEMNTKNIAASVLGGKGILDLVANNYLANATKVDDGGLIEELKGQLANAQKGKKILSNIYQNKGKRLPTLNQNYRQKMINKRTNAIEAKEGERLFFNKKGLDPNSLDYEKPIDFGNDADFIFKDDPKLMEYAKAVKRSYPDMNNYEVEAIVAGSVPDDKLRLDYLKKLGDGDESKGYDFYNSNINAAKDKYELSDIGTDITGNKDNKLTWANEENTRKRFGVYKPEIVDKERNLEEVPTKVPKIDIPNRKLDIPNKQETPNLDEPITPKKETDIPEDNKTYKYKQPYDPYQVSKIQNFGEGLLNTATGLSGTINGLKAYRELQKLRKPKYELPVNVKPAEKENLDDEKRGIAGQSNAMIKKIQGNTGNLQALLSGISNVNKQQQDANVNLENSANANFMNDKMNREFKQLKDISDEQAKLNYVHDKENYDERKRALKNAAEKGFMTTQNSAKNLLNIFRNNADMYKQNWQDKEKVVLLKKAAKQDYLEKQREKNPNYYYKIDANGNKVATTEEEKLAFENQWGKSFDETSGREYAELEDQVNKYGGGNKFFKRYTTSFPIGEKVVENKGKVSSTPAKTYEYNANTQNNILGGLQQVIPAQNENEELLTEEQKKKIKNQGVLQKGGKSIPISNYTQELLNNFRRSDAINTQKHMMTNNMINNSSQQSMSFIRQYLMKNGIL